MSFQPAWNCWGLQIVYPAASYINYFRGRNLVVINKSDTARSVNATLMINDPIGEVLGQIKVR